MPIENHPLLHSKIKSIHLPVISKAAIFNSLGYCTSCVTNVQAKETNPI